MVQRQRRLVYIQETMVRFRPGLLTRIRGHQRCKAHAIKLHAPMQSRLVNLIDCTLPRLRPCVRRPADAARTAVRGVVQVGQHTEGQPDW